MDKYYTPEISEFYIGFEFEYTNWGGWSKSNDFNDLFITDDTNIISELKWDIEHNKIRVKYLDRRDIESLGWMFEKQHAGLEEICFSTGGPEFEDILYMNYDLDSKYMRISWLGEGDITRFSGTIKNKSELKVLIKQLGINEQ